jgi:hypothetical protein
VTVSGNNSSRVFEVGNDAAHTSFVIISGLTIAAGNAGASLGGGIFNEENLRLDGCTIRDSFGGTGGGVFNFTTGVLTVVGSTISGNSSIFDGGGIASQGIVTVQNSTISGNAATGSGGGINCAYGLLGYAALTVQNSTITQNHADDDGGGIHFGYATVRLHNTIVADNFKGSGTALENDIVASNGAVSAVSSNNLIGTGGSGGLNNGANGNKVAVANPLLGPLTDNGGPTATHSLVVASPALNAGNNAQAPGATDQRGSPFVRMFGDAVDIGAFEAQPMSLVVDTNADENDGNYRPGDLSLREALQRTNLNIGADTISFSAAFFNTPRTITLTMGSLPVRDDLTITGPSKDRLTVSGNGSTSVLDVSDLSATVRVVAISGMTITAGNAAAYGGGITNDEHLTISRAAITGNFAPTGGGGIANTSPATLIVHQSILSGNTTAGGGGAILNVGEVVILESTVSENQATYYGGGILNLGNLVVQNTTISGNRADIFGGGISSYGGDAIVLNSTITQNHCDNVNANLDNGGGILVADSDLLVSNTIVADNFRGSGNTIENDIVLAMGGTMNFGSSNNLIGTGGSGGLTNGVNGNQVGVTNPRLGPLANNGGPTPTHALIIGSPAIDSGDPAFAGPPTSDQRGVPYQRIASGRIDVGAFEFQTVSPAAFGDYNRDGRVTAADYIVWRNTEGDTVAPFAGADGNGNSMIDQGDYQVWRNNFGNTVPPGAGNGNTDRLIRSVVQSPTPSESSPAVLVVTPTPEGSSAAVQASRAAPSIPLTAAAVDEALLALLAGRDTSAFNRDADKTEAIHSMNAKDIDEFFKGLLPIFPGFEQSR